MYRIAIFSVSVLKEERVVVVAEQKPNCTDEVVGCTRLDKRELELNVND